MEILVLKLTNLRNEEHYKFNLDFMGLVGQYTPVALGIELKYPPYLAAFGKEELALNIMRGSAITEELNDADNLRDTTCSGLSGTIKSALNHYNAEVQKSAKRLTLLLDSYGNLAIKPYDQETASIIKLVAELEGAYSADVTTLGIGGWVQVLKSQNLAFDNVKNQRYDENTAKPQQNLKLARYATDLAYKEIVKLVNALIVVNGSTAYSAFVNALNERIENYQNVLAQRQGRNAKDDDDEGGTSDGEEALKK